MRKTKTGYRIAGVDVGGTFTDLVFIDSTSGEVRIGKTLSTPDDPSRAVLEALTGSGVAVASLDLLVHGTTVTTNALLERRLARTGLITTAGFRDVLELGRRTRPQPYGMFGRFEPLIPRDLRLEVDERIDAAGRVIRPLDTDALRRAAGQLIDAGCESVVIHFLHAYRNPAHELEALAIVRDLWPDDNVTVGHALLSEAREYERGVTAAVNAAVRPILARYLSRLRVALESLGYPHDYLVMNGNGGTISSREAAFEAARTVMSGPASGVIAATRTAAGCGLSRLISYDMGGTSTDVALVRDGRPLISNEIELEYALPIHVPMVDVRTIGAGGGSIARIDDAGLLAIGPQSAGADPGPICYGRGGEKPTITDANLLLGRLDTTRLSGIDSTNSTEPVASVFEHVLGKPLQLDAVMAADAVLRVANLRMAGAVRMVSVSRGHDPRDFTLVAFGGAGPLHAVAVARELGLPRVLIPPRPGIANAIGCMVADLRHDYVNTVNQPVFDCNPDELRAILEQQIATGHAALARESVRPEAVHVEHSADMQFVGQTHLIRVSLATPAITLPALQSAFEQAYFARFRVRLPEVRARLVNLNTTVTGIRPAADLSGLLPGAERATHLAGALQSERAVWFGDRWHATPVYDRERLPVQFNGTGPAILEQYDTTTVIEPGDRFGGDREGNIMIDVAGAGPQRTTPQRAQRTGDIRGDM